MKRRTFLKTVGGVALCGQVVPRAAGVPEVGIDLSLDKPGVTIAPHLYGHFIEHLGGVIYDGIWVGPSSRIPNVDGFRSTFVEDMRALRAPVLRWPGGCFADGYHWRDGIGAPDRRRRTYNFWESRMPPGMHATETNAFGVHEFIRLCRRIGAAPYLAANVGSGSPQEFHDWVSYCNAPAGSVSLADERAANGDRDPFAVRYWGVGNESWGCGGDMTPGEYATAYRRFVAQCPEYLPLFLVAAGPRGHSRDMDVAWTTGFFDAMQGGHRSPVHGFSPHFYTDFRTHPMRVANFTVSDWYAVLLEGLRTEQVIEAHWAAMGPYDPERRTKLVIDEWGVWYRPGEEIAPGYILSQPVTLRDALHTALTFDVFNRHADKIEMANVAQTINCIHSLFLAFEDKYTRTPTYHVFSMYIPHMGARHVPLRVDAEPMAVPAGDGTARMPVLSGSASMRESSVTITLTNPSVDTPVTARIRMTGGKQPVEARGTVLTHEDMRARNTFDAPDEVRPSSLPVSVVRDAVQVQLPKASVAALEIRVN